MNTSEWVVLIGAVAAIAWVNWYFFLAERSSDRARTATDSKSHRHDDSTRT